MALSWRRALSGSKHWHRWQGMKTLPVMRKAQRGPTGVHDHLYYAYPICWKEVSMQATEQDVANRQVGRALLEGCSWREAVQAAGVQMSRATAYRLRQRMLAGGEEAVYDRRQGHTSKVRGAVRTWLEDY